MPSDKTQSYTYSLTFSNGGFGASGDDAAVPPTADMSAVTPLWQCAESKVYLCDFYGAAAVCKHRFVKSYRHRALDTKLREQRTAREARALVRCRKAGIRVPTVYGVDKRACKIFMERIPGDTVKDALDIACANLKKEKEEENRKNSNNTLVKVNGEEESEVDGKAAEPTPAVARLLHGIGEMVGLLHNINVIHGDLTTSNFMTMEKAANAATTASGTAGEQTLDRDGLVVIDLGLVTDKTTPEERAVDLYVLERAIASTHPFLERYAARVILEGYHRTVDPKKGKMTLAKLEAVRARGRKRSMVG